MRLVDGTSAAAWVGAIGAIGAWVTACLALGKARESNQLTNEQNVKIEKSNSIAKRALEVSQEQADRALDTVKWSVVWVPPGVLICTNTSAKHSAKQAQMLVTLTDFATQQNYNRPPDPAKSVGPTQQLVARFVPVTEDMKWSDGLRADTLHFLTCKITWISERGRADEHTHVDLVSLDLG